MLIRGGGVTTCFEAESLWPDAAMRRCDDAMLVYDWGPSDTYVG